MFKACFALKSDSLKDGSDRSSRALSDHDIRSKKASPPIAKLANSPL